MSRSERRRRDVEDELARVYRDFADGLVSRLTRVRAGLEALRARWSREVATELRRETHTLKGTASSFGATAIAEVAAELTDLAAGWLEAGAVDPEGLGRGADLADRLERRIAEYRERSPGPEA